MTICCLHLRCFFRGPCAQTMPLVTVFTDVDALIGSKQEACHSVAIEAILIFTLSQLGELGRFAKWFMMLRPRISSTTFSATKLLVRWRSVV